MPEREASERDDSWRLTPRRLFLRTLGASAAALLALAAWPRRLVAAKRLAIPLDKAPALAEVGGSVILRIKERDILFIRDTEQSIRALNPVCSHQRNTVAYLPREKVIQCPAHGSRYDLEGRVLKGPSTAPLRPVYEAQLDLAKNRILLTL